MRITNFDVAEQQLALDIIVTGVRIELNKALENHEPMNSAHEGYAVILEELEEAWAEIKRHDVDQEALRKEMVQVAAMAIRFILDVCDKERDYEDLSST